MHLLLEKCIGDFISEYKIPMGFSALDAKISWAVNEAYGDMTPRTIKNHTADIKRASIEDLKKWFEEYFDKTPPANKKEFCKCHSAACEAFQNEFNVAAEHNGVQLQAFGKAQKIVNMSFKYLYCMLRDEKAPWFAFCHMPLDSYTLNWFYRAEKVRAKEKKERYPEEKTWSNLTKEQYDDIAAKIEAYVDDQFSGFSPLEAEFIIWPIEKSIVSVKELKSAIQKACSNKIITAHLGQTLTDHLVELGNVENLTFEKALNYEITDA